MRLFVIFIFASFRLFVCVVAAALVAALRTAKGERVDEDDEGACYVLSARIWARVKQKNLMP